jgi:hypothetical protein
MAYGRVQSDTVITKKEMKTKLININAIRSCEKADTVQP